MAFSPIEWPVDSSVTLCRVPWDAAYRDLVRFPSQEARDSYFMGLAGESITLDHMTYLKPNEPININTPYSQAYTYNYCVVHNPALPVPGEVTPPTLYYFITSAAYVAPNTTALTLQLDVWQTYAFDVRFGRCFVERGHASVQAECAVNGTDGTVANGTRHWNAVKRYLTVAEGLDVGNEYPVIDYSMIDYAPSDEDGNKWMVMVNANTNLRAEFGTKTNPSLDTAHGIESDNIITGNDLICFVGSDILTLMSKLSEYSWVGKGVTGFTAFPSSMVNLIEYPAFDNALKGMKGYRPQSGNSSIKTASDNITDGLGNGVPDRYQHLHKFYTFPYSIIELDANTGNTLQLKPELCSTTKMQLHIMPCVVPPHMRVAFIPVWYGRGVSNEAVDDLEYEYWGIAQKGTDPATQKQHSTSYNGYYMNTALIIDDWPTFATVNDEYNAYLASTTNRRQYSYQAAGWALQKSNAGTNLAYEQAMQQLDVNQRNMDISNMMTVAGAATGTLANVAGGVGAGFTVGGPIGAAAGGLGALGAAIPNLVNTGINLAGSNAQFQNNQQLAESFAGQNRSMSQWAARGDYQNAIASINATVQDAALTQPSQSGVMGGNGFNLAKGLTYLRVNYRMCDRNHVSVIGEFWLRYGYAIHEFIQPPSDLMCMTKATYWKMQETYLTCARASEDIKNAIRGIFERGTTVWADPADIGVMDWADNMPLGEVNMYTNEGITKEVSCY